MSHEPDGPAAVGQPPASAFAPPPPPSGAAPDAPMVEALHRLLADSVVDYAIYALTADGRIATWSAGAERLKGFTAAEIVGQPVSRFYPPETHDSTGAAPRAVELLHQAARDGRAEDEGWRVRRDGSRFWAHVVITPVRHPDGALLGFAKVT
ncbi:MAG TPA: PAS domain-containing protein, partial [Gemmatimonadaceae bacterium]|nr:PAS domain-containing protein [Gemmatimonadaceae bacterium]